MQLVVPPLLLRHDRPSEDAGISAEGAEGRSTMRALSGCALLVGIALLMLVWLDANSTPSRTTDQDAGEYWQATPTQEAER